MPRSASLHARDVTYSVGRTRILDGLELDVTAGRRVGLIGPNGVGKSTLLRILAGALRPDRGSVTTTPPNAAVGLLPQERERRSEAARAYLARRTGTADASAALDAATAALAAGHPGADDAYSAALERWLALGAADFDHRVDVVWSELGLAPRLLDQPMTSLSGGEAARAGVAALVLSQFDVYLLDEPTNDVDLESLERLERWVCALDAPVVLVSHDRRFLERTVTHVAELDEFTHRLTVYGGGWVAYQDERATAARHAQERYEEYSTKRSDLAARAQREREWASQGLRKAKTQPSDNDKNIKAFKINQSEQLAGKAARTERAMERLEVVDKPMEAWHLQLSFAAAERSGDRVCELVGAAAERGDFRLGPVDVVIGYGERVAVVGPNGSGKSTLLGMLLGRVELAAGRHWMGPGVRVGEVEQARARLDADGTVLRTFIDATGMTVSDARTLLAKFGIGANHVERPVASLSPGERTRAVLALLMAGEAPPRGHDGAERVGANLLVLDEPTNHLDLAAIEQLEVALEQFPGTVLLVTHDRALLEHVRLTRTIELADGQVVADRVSGGTAP